MKKLAIIIICLVMVLSVIIFVLNGMNTDAEAEEPNMNETEIEAESGTDEQETSDMTKYTDLVPSLRDGYSEFVGPWAYVFYAKDERTEFTYHEADDGYVPRAGDLIVTGDEYDELYIDRRSKQDITGLGQFDYWFDDYAWNGHILYVDSVDGNILTCYEGNSIAPWQDLDVDDPDFIYKSSVDMIEIDYSTSETLTPGKVAEKEIRAVIETDLPEEFVAAVAVEAANILAEFDEDPDGVREDIMSLYPADIDWCGLFIHYLLLQTVNGIR